MVSLVWNSDDVADVYMSLFRKGEPYQYMEMPRELLFEMVADRVVKNGRDVGMATSRCYSYYFREMISLCVLDVELCTPGTDVTVIWGDPGKLQKQIQAKVAPAPYKTDRRRIDVKTLPSYLK
jgi:glycine cleavage system aminomethyltransferase T